MAMAAGLLSPALVSLVRRAQQVRQEMDYFSSSETINQKMGGSKCKACSCETLSHEEWRKSTDALNNNLRPKSDHHASTQNRKIPISAISSLSETADTPLLEDMDNSEYFNVPVAYEWSPTRKSSPPSNKSLKRSLSDYQTNGSRPPLPPKKSLGRTTSGDIASKINKFEQMAKEGSPPKDDIQKGLWYYKDGLRSPTTPPPRSRSNSLSPSPLGTSTTSLPVSVQISLKDTPSPQPPASFVHNGQIEPKVITAALASSPKLFQKSEKTVSIPAAFVLTPKNISPAPTPPRTPSPAMSNGPSRPPRKKTPPTPPPRTNSSLFKKAGDSKLEKSSEEAAAHDEAQNDMVKALDHNLKLDQILDICADFEKQIQAEQDELRLIAQKRLEEEENELSFKNGGIYCPSSTPPLPACKGSTSPLKSPTNGLSPLNWSPLNTMSPNRIKTNGSLPRPHDFNGQTLASSHGSKTPTSPSLAEAMFSFESTFANGYNSPQSSLGRATKKGKTAELTNSPYENVNASLLLARGSQSPRNHIRTTINSAEPFNDSIMNGGGEEMFSTTKSKEQLYIEAKHVLNMVEPYTVNGTSPSSSVPRKPPRSKHDPGSTLVRPPSEEASSRVLIGTYMIGGQSKTSPEQTLTKPALFGYSSIERVEVLRSEYQAQLQLVSNLKKRLNDLELRETEEIDQLEFERSLLNAEFDSETQKISKAKMRIALLKHKEIRLSGIYDELQREYSSKMREAQSRMAALEESIEEMCQSSLDGARLDLLNEQLEIEKKAFEDLEFQQMEEATHKETEREELLKEIHELERQADEHESQLAEIDNQQKELLANVRKEAEELEKQRKLLTAQLTKEKQKMKSLEQRLSDLKKVQFMPPGEEFMGETESEDESIANGLQELESSLSRLALLDKTQAEINQISMATTSMMQQSPKKFVRISTHNWNPPKSDLDFDCLNSIGSENGSLSESLNESNECISNGKKSRRERKLKPSKDPESTSSGQSPDLTAISRPMSEESSLWDDSEAEVRKRQHKIQQQRPLTRYLPIRNENFDLRAHIESAGHQIDLCQHVVLTADSCRGYLQKLSGNHQSTSAAAKRFRSKWNKRWFVFDRNKRAVIYYSDKSESKAKGGVYFQSIEEVYVDHLNNVKSPNAKVTFCMKTTDRTYFLMAPSPESMRIWVDVIFTGAEGYQEF